jgi:para-nitrobenzyl esterase
MTGTIAAVAPAGTFIGTVGDDGQAVFAGIPFAEPPVGARRFRPPVAQPDSDGEVDATRFRAAPLQRTSWQPDAFEVSEDCLYLNVWTPDVSASRPVIVWIYGGGYEGGSAAPPFTPGGGLAAATDTVVVAMNYRVGALGFGYWAGVGGSDWETSGNLGLQDQVMALCWVRRNIAAFGGDPENVTLAGESAGAFSIGSLLGAPSAKGLFGKAIMASGHTGRTSSTDAADALARHLLAEVGVATMAELQAVDAERILEAQAAVVDSDVGDRNLPGGRIWCPVLDGHVLPEYPQEVLASGRLTDIPLLVSATRDEAQLFRVASGDAFEPAGDDAVLAEMARAGVPDPAALAAAYRAHGAASGPDPTAGDVRSMFLSDVIYRRPVVAMAEAQNAAGGSAWAYLFSASPLGRPMGAAHAMDMMYVFDGLAAADAETPENLAVRDAMTRAWRDFVRHGQVEWAPYRAADPDNVRQFGGDADAVTEPPSAIAEVWPLVLEARGRQEDQTTHDVAENARAPHRSVHRR